ncbi:DUF6550 family protein [Anaerosolibacter sp.]|uniref:DUF6550 family protein n=1 Tax=Anaerosolibacter sp. TaxID=1872527 RepID=UPI0039EE68F7
MKKTTVKRQRTLVIAVLLIIAFVLIGGIYMMNNRQNATIDLQANEANNDVQVEAIDMETENAETVEVEEVKKDEVVIQEIEVSGSNTNSDSKVQEETIDEPMPVEPEKPANTPPSHTPQTTDNLENTDKVPEYSEEETSYTPEELDEEEKPVVTEINEESNLVPDSQNPFLQPNIPSNGDAGEMKGSDYYQDGIPAGEGDKF